MLRWAGQFFNIRTRLHDDKCIRWRTPPVRSKMQLPASVKSSVELIAIALSCGGVLNSHADSVPFGEGYLAVARVQL